MDKQFSGQSIPFKGNMSPEREQNEMLMGESEDLVLTAGEKLLVSQLHSLLKYDYICGIKNMEACKLGAVDLGPQIEDADLKDPLRPTPLNRGPQPRAIKNIYMENREGNPPNAPNQQGDFQSGMGAASNTDPMSQNSEYDIFITYPDVSVWFYNKSAQKSLPLVKKIWEETECDIFGKKLLNHFLFSYASYTLKLHKKYRLKLLETQDFHKLQKNTSTFQLNEKPLRPNKNIKSIENMYFNFTIDEIRLEEANLTHTFDGTSKGFRAEIWFQGLKVMETGYVNVDGNSIEWTDGFQLEVPILCGWLTFKFYERIKNHKMHNTIEILSGTCKIDLFKEGLLNEDGYFKTKINEDQFEAGYNLIPQPDPYCSFNKTFPVECENLFDIPGTKFEVKKPKLEFTLKTNQEYFDIRGNLVQYRIKYLEKLIQKLVGSITLIKENIGKLIKPFPQLDFDENGLYISVAHQLKKQTCKTFKCKTPKCIIF